jgi:argininosuccinate lyase
LSSVIRGGRLDVPTKREVVEFISSGQSDRRIARSIVLANEAHVVALLKAGIVNRKEAQKILRQLRRLEKVFPAKGVDEDYHLYVEEQLTKRLGPELGGKLHTAKSRNDQVATAIRMSLRKSLLDLSESLLNFAQKLLAQATRHSGTFFVGYTHQQPAQPITYGHYLVSILDPLLRDNERILESYHRVNKSPMGAGALAGSSYDLDRRLVAQLLGFEGLVENSLDAVGSRDFLLESLAVSSLVGSDLSRIAQDWIFYSSGDVNLVDLSPEYSSTSSIMPQKKNPDPLEVVRARCAVVEGNIATSLTIAHALPSGYNLDLQELTPIVWNSIDTLCSCLSIMTGVISHMSPAEDIADRYPVKFTVATELANSLARDTKAPFRDAYRWVGQAVRTALKNHRTLRDLSRDEWTNITGKQLDKDAYRTIQALSDPRSHPSRYASEGSPNPREVQKMVAARRDQVRKDLVKTRKLEAKIESANRRLRHIL